MPADIAGGVHFDGVESKIDDKGLRDNRGDKALAHSSRSARSPLQRPSIEQGRMSRAGRSSRFADTGAGGCLEAQSRSRGDVAHGAGTERSRLSSHVRRNWWTRRLPFWPALGVKIAKPVAARSPVALIPPSRPKERRAAIGHDAASCPVASFVACERRASFRDAAVPPCARRDRKGILWRVSS